MDFAESLTPCARFWSHFLEASEYLYMQMHIYLKCKWFTRSPWSLSAGSNFFSPLGCNWTPQLKIHKGICFISFFSFTMTGASATFMPTAASLTKRNWLASVSTTLRGLTVAAVRGIIRPELGALDPISPSPRAQQISVSIHTHIPIPLTGKNNMGSMFVDNKAHMSFYSDHKPSLLLLSYLSQCSHGVSPEAITLLPISNQVLTGNSDTSQSLLNFKKGYQTYFIFVLLELQTKCLLLFTTDLVTKCRNWDDTMVLLSIVIWYKMGSKVSDHASILHFSNWT